MAKTYKLLVIQFTAQSVSIQVLKVTKINILQQTKFQKVRKLQFRMMQQMKVVHFSYLSQLG